MLRKLAVFRKAMLTNGGGGGREGMVVARSGPSTRPPGIWNSAGRVEGRLVGAPEHEEVEHWALWRVRRRHV